MRGTYRSGPSVRKLIEREPCVYCRRLTTQGTPVDIGVNEIDWSVHSLTVMPLELLMAVRASTSDESIHVQRKTNLNLYFYPASK